MSLLAVAQPSIEATSSNCDSTLPWIKTLTRSRRRCATGLTLFLPVCGVAMDTKMKTLQCQLGGTRNSWICLAAPLTMREGNIEENNSRVLATPSTQFRCISEDARNLKFFVGSSRRLAFRSWSFIDSRRF
ncbi:hypothetical protein RDI58_006945 [Solanum bulbocastanum]|uniref:Uncharacterized protein n=1 Tax=Solanum bulbocastanum TaxID=147425 RepID=A0AAN8TZ28_SOLBU